MSIRNNTKGAFGRSSRNRLNGLGLELLENRRLLAAAPIAGDFTEITENWNFRGQSGELMAIDSSSAAFEATENSDRFSVRWVDPDGDIVHFNYAGQGDLTFELLDAQQVDVNMDGETVSMFQGNMDISIDNTNSFSSLQILTNPSGFGMDPVGAANDGLSDLKLILFNDNANPLTFGNLQAAQAQFSGSSGNVGILGANTSLAATGLLRVGDVTGSGSAVGNLQVAPGSQNTWEIFGGTLDFNSGTPININAGATPFFASLGVSYPTGVTVDADPQEMRDNLPTGARALQLDSEFTITDSTTQAEIDDHFSGFTFVSPATVAVEGDPTSLVTVGNMVNGNSTTFQAGLTIDGPSGLTDANLNADFNNNALAVNTDLDNVDIMLQNSNDLRSFTMQGNAVDVGIMEAPFTNASVGNVSITGTDHQNVGIVLDAIGDVNITGNVASDGLGNGLLLAANGAIADIGDISVDGNVGDVNITSTRNIGNVAITGGVAPTAAGGFAIQPGMVGRVGDIAVDGTFATPAPLTVDFDANPAGGQTNIGDISIGTVDDANGALTIVTGETNIESTTIGKGDVTVNIDNSGVVGDITLEDGVATLTNPNTDPSNGFLADPANEVGLVSANGITLANSLTIGNGFGGLHATADNGDLNIDQSITVNSGNLGQISHEGDDADIVITKAVSVNDGDLGELATTGTASGISILGGSVGVNGHLGGISIANGTLIGVSDTNEVSAYSIGDISATNITTPSEAVVQGFGLTASGPADAEGNPTLGSIGNIDLTNDVKNTAVFGGGLSEFFAAGNIGNIALTADETGGAIIEASSGAFIGAGNDGTGVANTGFVGAVAGSIAQNVSIGNVTLTGDFDYEKKASGGGFGPFGGNGYDQGLIITSGFQRDSLGAVLDTKGAGGALRAIGEATTFSENNIEKDVSGSVGAITFNNLAGVDTLTQSSRGDINDFTGSGGNSLPSIVAQSTGPVNGTPMASDTAIKLGFDNTNTIDDGGVNWSDFVVANV